MANIAVFGGTFNPFHIGHYQMLTNICKLDYIDKVFVMPDKIPPHKECDYIADDIHRQNMCRIVCEDFDKAEICLVEFERDGKSYTVDTIKELKNKYPNDKFFVVIGGDMLSTLDKWYNWQELISLIAFIAFKRQGLSDFSEAYSRLTYCGADIKTVDSSIIKISSTELRQKIDKNLLPEKVYNYIISEGIYNV